MPCGPVYMLACQQNITYFLQVALNALKALYHHKSPIGLVGNHIDVMTGRWTAQDSGIGGGVDSYFEYLVKGMLKRKKLSKKCSCTC